MTVTVTPTDSGRSFRIEGDPLVESITFRSQSGTSIPRIAFLAKKNGHDLLTRVDDITILKQAFTNAGVKTEPSSAVYDSASSKHPYKGNSFVVLSDPNQLNAALTALNWDGVTKEKFLNELESRSKGAGVSQTTLSR
jgi:hypothetical protein